MATESGYIQAGTEQLHYIKWGTGPRLLLAFHGYNNEAGIFSGFADHLEDQYTIISFDLPHHGKSKWTTNTLLRKEWLITAIIALMAKQNAGKISLLGYSMGGRICMSILESMPTQIDKVALVATDGLAVNVYYYFFTRNFIGKKMFANMLSKPQPYFKLLDWLKKRKIITESRHRFVMYFLQSQESREQLLQVWPAISDFMPSPSKLRSLINKYHIPIAIFMGAYDKVMPPALALKFKQGLDTVQVHILEKGHRIFDNETSGQIAAFFI